ALDSLPSFSKPSHSEPQREAVALQATGTDGQQSAVGRDPAITCDDKRAQRQAQSAKSCDWLRTIATASWRTKMRAIVVSAQNRKGLAMLCESLLSPAKNTPTGSRTPWGFTGKNC